MEKDVKKVVNGNAQEGASVESQNQVAEKKRPEGKTKSKRKCPLDRVLEHARKLYLRQVTKDAQTWGLVIDRSIQTLYPGQNYTKNNLLADIAKRIYRLLDSKKFERDCRELSLDPFAVATHISLQAITRLYAVLDYGIRSNEAGFSSYLSDMKQPVFEYQDFPNAEIVLGYVPKSADPSQVNASTQD